MQLDAIRSSGCDGDSGHVRAEWLHAVLDWCQCLVGELDCEDVAAWTSIVKSADERLPRPTSVVEYLVLTALFTLIEHRLVTNAYFATSSVDGCLHLARALPPPSLTTGPANSPATHFATWIADFVSVYATANPPPPEIVAARLIRERLPSRITSAQLAAAARCSAPHLRAAFERSFGVSIHEYRDIACVLAAIVQVRAGVKIEAIAIEIDIAVRKIFTTCFVRLRV